MITISIPLSNADSSNCDYVLYSPNSICPRKVLIRAYTDKVGKTIDFDGVQKRVESVKITENCIFVEIDADPPLGQPDKRKSFSISGVISNDSEYAPPVREIVFKSLNEATTAITDLIELINKYGYASIWDYYSLLGLDGSLTDKIYGWTKSSIFSTSTTKDGYKINLPRVSKIKF